MHLPSHPSLSLLALSSTASAILLDCKKIPAQGARFDLHKLGGPHSVVVQNPAQLSETNTTWTVDICKALTPGRGVDKADFCPLHTRVCGIETHAVTGEPPAVDRVIPIAGQFEFSGRHLDPKYTRLKTSESHGDADKEGVRLTLHGGRYPWDDQKSAAKPVRQKALIEFICDPTTTGTAGGGHDDDDDDEDDTTGPGELLPDGKPPLRFVSYGPEGEPEEGTLRLAWRSKYACESGAGDDDDDDDDDDDEKDDEHPKRWGFFTWFIIILFLCTAAYLIFGSWLNYNRYGARGWDLLPHGDTIRDLPYLVKDWGRRAANTVQGSGSRGAYSAIQS